MRRRLLVVCVVLPLLLAGCGGDPDEGVTAAPTPSTSPTPVVESSTPPAAETPEDYLRRWLRLEVEMENSGDSTAYRAATKGCQTCSKFADQIDGYYEAGGYVRTAGQSVLRIKQTASSGIRSVYRVGVDPEPTEYLTEAGGAVQNLAGEPITFEATLVRRGNAWTLSDYTQLAS